MKKKLLNKPWGKMIQSSGPFTELFLHYKALPNLDLNNSFYLIEIKPLQKYVPTEYVIPHSEGPIFFYLREGVSYQINILVSPNLTYKVTSKLTPFPWVDLTQEHGNNHSLVWGHIDITSLTETSSSRTIIITADNKTISTRPVNAEPLVRINGRPQQIALHLDNGTELFKLKTNLGETKHVASAKFAIPEKNPHLYLSSIIKPNPGWQVRAELPFFQQMHKKWQTLFQVKYPGTLKYIGQLTGSILFIEDGKPTQQFRLFGYHLRSPEHLFNKPELEFELQLQITSPHRELYRTAILKKQYKQPKPALYLTDADIEEAQKRLFQLNKHVCWDQSLLQMVLYSISKDGQWQEEIRETAQIYRWDYTPQLETKKITAQWIITDSRDIKKELICLKSASLNKDNFPNKVVLKPYNSKKLLAWWDLDQQGVEHFLWKQWQTKPAEVGFYLKVNEEYLGKRIHRSDLDMRITDLFSPYKNIYLNIDAEKCYSTEIVARHEKGELALTPVSRSIVAPRDPATTPAVNCSYADPGPVDFHPSQREVLHSNGSDAHNRAKIMIHLHMHSPNLFRAEPFRESFLKDVTWPYRDDNGTEIHNTPGEWIFKNCMESWLPLLRSFRTLVKDGIDFQVSLDITPPVAYSLNSSRFKDYMSRYLLRVQKNIKTQIALMKVKNNDERYMSAAWSYFHEIEAISIFYNNELNKDMLAAFRELEEKGYLEISTCTATHGMPAELESIPDSLDAQITLAGRSHHRLFQKRPKGIWLAENSIFPGIEHVLQKEHLQYFFCEAEAVLQGSAKCNEEEFSPVVLPGSNVTAFGRSRMGRLQIWDAKLGYAGHPEFREYHFRHYGLPLKKITSKTSNDKQPYNPERAKIVAQELARDFYYKLKEKAGSFNSEHFKNTPLITCSYDAELFGHHWAEGPIFLEELLREFYRSGDEIGLTTPSHYLVNSSVFPEVMPNPSTWGHETTHVLWSDPKVAWTQRELERADNLLKIYLKHTLEGDFNDYQIRATEQMGAEMIRAQSSDLTFVIMAGAFEEDMQREILKYLDYFYRLKSLIDNNIEDEDFLTFRTYENDMFPELRDYYGLRK